MRNVAYTYDNAISLIAFLAAGERDRARLIADAFIYALHNDPFYTDRRLRNAYSAGRLTVPPGWKPNGKVSTVRLPGWYDATRQEWLEDRVQISTNTGNLAWVILALSAFSESTGDRRSLQAAEELGDWIDSHCREPKRRGAGGYLAGFEGEPNDLVTLQYKATEHAIDLYAAFRRLYRLTRNDKWRDRAEYSKQFLRSMWDPKEGKFWTGTGNDGETVNMDVIPVDVQAWAVLALADEEKGYERALEYADEHLRAGSGFDFNQDGDGVWYEGTAQMAVAFGYVGNEGKKRELLSVLRSGQLPSGAVPAASKDGLTTGFYFSADNPWLYFRRAHIAATAWSAIAELGVNPLK